MSNAFQINRKVRDAVILNLRRVFTGDPKYPYVETPEGEYDFANTKVVISDIIPQESAFFPAIVVDTVSGEEERYLGDDLGELKDSNNVSQADMQFSSIVLTVNVSFYTIDDTIARDELVDRVYDHFKSITDDLADSGIEIIKTSFLSDRRTFVLDRYLIVAGLSLKVYTEWNDQDTGYPTIATIPIDVTTDPGGPAGV